MKPAELISAIVRSNIHLSPPDLLRLLASSVLNSELKDGARVLDASDFKEWLGQLADEMNQVTA